MTGKTESFYPLTPMQEGMLYHTLYAPGAGLYLEQNVYPMQGRVNVPAFERGWQTVVDHHAALRTLFVWEDLKEPIQAVEQKARVRIHQEDWRQMSSQQQKERLRQYLRLDRERGFQLSQAPLMRFALIRVGEEAYTFVWSWHHLLMDGWSSSLVVRQVISIYEAACRGMTIELERSRPFREYVVWLRRQDAKKSEQYWRAALKGLKGPTRLGVYEQAAEKAGSEGYGEQAVVLTQQATTQLNRAAGQQKVTLNTVAQGAWAILLRRYSGEQDVVFGAVVAGRPAELEGVEAMVGLFINTLPVRVTANDEATVGGWLKALQSAQAEARKYEYSPLVQIQGWSEVPRSMPLFESIIAFENFSARKNRDEPEPDAETTTDDYPAMPRARSYERVNYPLAVVVVPGKQLILQITYDKRQFEGKFIAQMLKHYRLLLESIGSARSEQRLEELEMMTASERRQILDESNNTTRVYPTNKCVHELFEHEADRRPDAIAVECGGRLISYRELNERGNQLARYLRKKGVGPEVLVGICADRSVEMIVGLLGIIKAGAAYVPLDPAYPLHRISMMISDTKLHVVLAQSHLLDKIRAPSTEVICIDSHWDEIAQLSGSNLGRTAIADNLIYVIYTSGSTAIPKGVCVSHRAVVRLVVNTDFVSVLDTDRVAQASNSSFDAATFEIWGALLNGASLVVIPKQLILSPTELAAELKALRVTTLFLTTALFNQVASQQPEAFRSLRHLLFGGEAVDPNWVRKVLNNGPPDRLLHVYGPTEGTTFTTWQKVEVVARDARTIPIGTPIGNTQTYVLDSNLQLSPTGICGELFIGGDGLARGYLNRPGPTAERFIPNPYGKEEGARLYRTGDMVRNLEGGAIEFLGRTDGQVKIRGYRVELGEIASVLGEYPAVEESVVVATADEGGSKRLVAYVVGEEATTSEIRSYLSKRLPDYMVPSVYVKLDKLPLTPNGKIDRTALPALGQSRPEMEVSFVAPRDAVELKLAQAWEDVFNIRPIGVTDNFFELGGHSLLAVRLVARIHKDFGRTVSLSELMKEGNVATLANVLRESEVEASYSPIVPIQPKGDKTPFFCVHAIGGQVMGYYNLARRMGEDQPFYGLQARFLTEVVEQSETIEEMASEYVEAVTRVQPKGPYILGGYSFGGYVAFEMARQMESRGLEVSLVVIMDTWAPSIFQQFPGDEDEAFTLWRLARVRGQEMGRSIEVSEEGMRSMGSEQRLKYAFEQMRRVGVFDEGMNEQTGTQYIKGYVRGHLARQEAVRNYKPGIYGGNMVLIRCEQEDEEQGKIFDNLGIDVSEATYGWWELSREEVEVERVPGYHERMCQEPYVEVLAERINARIEKCTKPLADSISAS